METEVDMIACNIFNQLRFEKQLCDVLIRVDGAEFPAHKVILCGCSPYFRCLFTNCWNHPEKHEYIIPGVSSEIMALIMEYAYTQRVNITEKNVYELLIAADYLVLSDLVKECCVFLKTQLCVGNCFSIWRFAHFYFCQKLEQQAFKFILHNFQETVRISEDFLDVTAEELSAILEKDELNVKQENVVFEAIVQWIKHAPQDRKAQIETLLPKVRMMLLNHDYLLDNVRNNTFVADNAACKLIILSILKSMNGLDTYDYLSLELARPRLPSAVLLAIGGQNNFGSTNAIEAYDARAKRWVKLTCTDERSRAHHGTAVLNGFVYCIGGRAVQESFCSVSRFDPITRTWAQVGPMHYRRSHVSVCVLEGHVYAMGGYDGHDCLNTAERYNPETNQWCMIPPMHARRNDAGATSLNGKVYVCGGFHGNEYLHSAEYYSPQTSQWTLIPPMISRRGGLGVIAYDRHIYAVGGFTGAYRLRNAERYDPQTNSWSLIPDMTNQRCNFGIGVVDDLLFVVGGNNGLTTIRKVECYDNNTDKWYEMEQMEILRCALSCCVMSGLPNMEEYAAPRDKVTEHRTQGDRETTP